MELIVSFLVMCILLSNCAPCVRIQCAGMTLKKNKNLAFSLEESIKQTKQNISMVSNYIHVFLIVFRLL